MKRSPPTRWTEEVDPKAGPVARASELFRRGDPASLLTRATVERALARLDEPRRRPLGALAGRPLRYALAGLALVLAPVSFAAFARYAPPVLAPLWQRVTRGLRERPPPAPVPPGAHPADPVGSERAPEPELGIDLTTPFVPDRVIAPNLLAIETRALKRAVELLRARGDARAALAALDEYERKFPKGALLAESRLVRLDALLALDRRGEALRLLDRLGARSLARLPRGGALLLLHAELLREAGRCKEAVARFEQALHTRAPELRERALFGRATCRSAVGNERGARADLEQYQREFPQGTYAREATTLLERVKGRAR